MQLEHEHKEQRSSEEEHVLTSQLRPKRLLAKERALPHWPAPVSVTTFLTPAVALYHACGTAVLAL